MKPNMTMVNRDAQRTEYTARNVATSTWIVGLARFGYAVKGIVYLIIGGLAMKLAIGHGGAATDQRGALQTIYEQPFGKFLLIIVGLGLIGYALWSFIQAIFDTESKGNHAQGRLARAGYAAVGVAYALLAFGAFQLALGTGSVGQHSSTATQDWTARLLKLPFGQALVVLVGLMVLGIAFYLFGKAYSAKFQNRLALTGSTARLRRWVVDLGRLGYACTGYLGDLFYNMPLHVDEQHRGHGVGSIAELILHEPLRDESPASESKLPAEQTVEAREIVRQAVIVRTDAGSEPAYGPPSRWLMRMGGSATWGAARLRTLLHAVCGRRITFVHPLSASPSRLAPVRRPGASRVGSTLLWYTAGVPLEPGAHDNPAPSFVCPCRRCVRSAGHLGDPCSHVPLSGDARHAVHAVQLHMRRYNLLRPYEATLLGQSGLEQ